MLNVYCVSSAVEKFTPHIIAGAYEKYGGRIFVLCSRSDEVDCIDRVLWTFSSNAFVPHGTDVDSHKERHPILIGRKIPEENNFKIVVLLDHGKFTDWDEKMQYICITALEPERALGALPPKRKARCFVEHNKQWKELTL